MKNLKKIKNSILKNGLKRNLISGFATSEHNQHIRIQPNRYAF